MDQGRIRSLLYSGKWIILLCLLSMTGGVAPSAQEAEDDRSNHKHQDRLDWFSALSSPGPDINPVTQAAWEYQIQGRLDEALKADGYLPEQWSPLGPNRFLPGNSAVNRVGGMGRLNCIGFHPRDPRWIYAGSAGGGLWQSRDGGLSWALVTTDPRTLMVSGLAIDPHDPQIMYLLTGDGNGSVYSFFPEGPSVGVLKSLDGGKHWQATGLDWRESTSQFGFKLAMDPNDSRVLYVPADSGLYRTADGGDNWKMVQAGKFRDIEFKPGDTCELDGQALTCIAYASTTTKIFRTHDAGKNWSAVAMTLDWRGTPTGTRRIELAVSLAPGAEKIVYGLAGARGGLVGLYRSDDAGVQFELMSNSPNILGYKYYGGDTASGAKYALALAASPTDADEVLAGGLFNWKSNDGGATWGVLTFWQNLKIYRPFLHADTHWLEYKESEPGSGRYDMYCAHDGGLARSKDGGKTWVDLSDGLAVTRVYRICGSRQDPDLIYFGAQDVGSSRLAEGTAHVAFGLDGAECLISHDDDDTVYVSADNGLLLKSTNAAKKFVSVSPPGMASKGPWITPFVMHPTKSETLYSCYSDLYRSENGGVIWHNLTQGHLGSDDCVQVAIAEFDPDVVYVAKAQAVYRSTDGGTDWSFKIHDLPDQKNSITNLAVHPANPKHIWVTLGGYTKGVKLIESRDGGSSWENISGSLPNVPVYSLAYDLETEGLYVGTFIGVYYRSWSSRADCLLECNDWVPFVNRLPPLIVLDLEIHRGARKLRAGTWSMGVWEAALHRLGRAHVSAEPES